MIADNISRGGGDDKGVTKLCASSMIRVTNRIHWHPAEAEGGLSVNAEVLCVFGDAVCESPAPAKGEWAGVALLTTLKMLPVPC
jgi:hypothetical protein